MSSAMEAIRWIKIPFEEWEKKCNGVDAYSDLSPAMLSVAVVRESEVRLKLATLEKQNENLQAALREARRELKERNNGTWP